MGTKCLLCIRCQGHAASILEESCPVRRTGGSTEGPECNDKGRERRIGAQGTSSLGRGEDDPRVI